MRGGWFVAAAIGAAISLVAGARSPGGLGRAAPTAGSAAFIAGRAAAEVRAIGLMAAEANR